MVDVQSVVPRLRKDMRYAGEHNFVGVPIDGYDAPRCYLLETVALALARVDAELEKQQMRLQVYDCYRPVRAVQHFMRWAHDMQDQATKPEFYPALDKSRLVPQYIAEHSGHSRGATLDLTLLDCAQAGTTSDGMGCKELDMGTGFDYFGERAHTDSASVTAGQRANRHRLRDAMQAQGFVNYADEWWHYTFKPEPTPDIAYDFPVR